MHDNDIDVILSKRPYLIAASTEPSSRGLLATVLLAFAVATSAFGQDEPVGRSKNEKNFEILPAIAPSSSPELGLTLIGAALIAVRPFPSDTVSFRTTIGTSFSISVRGAVVFGTRINSSLLQDRMRVDADLSARALPDHYWGLGYDRASTIPRSDSTTAYDRTSWLIRPKILWRIRGNLFAGINIDLNYTDARNPNPVMQQDPDFIEYGPKNYNSGGGVIARFDSRDVPNNAYSGWYFEALQATHSSFLGGDNRYSVFDFDIRNYQQIGRPGSTLAWTARARITTGSAPYAEVSQLGSSNDLRGYRQGQYRDVAMAFAVVEFRRMLKRFWSDTSQNAFGEPHSRHGLTAWLGLGTIGKDDEGVLKGLWNFGFGYRFEAMRRTNVRLDFGWGRSGFGFYLDFAEAF